MEGVNNLSVKDIISENLEFFFKLDQAGVKTIKAAIDLKHVHDVYLTYSWIESIKERKSVTASQCKVCTGTVEKAIALMTRKLKTETANPTFK
ncbi:hypothetical protein CLU96_1240 [Chryseobacterium sp. 52]|uniref:hypothetical protein n=1 Tax=Chryseobacterium sp. 52 TaxID=2035213 RepID=UPI000C18ADC3|nr:hypothetical protein [Chryseobacterium sp. 52]PIF44299.1 hypothetical protein CLU96_1240 [Chryseobacterium sp. 52]